MVVLVVKTNSLFCEGLIIKYIHKYGYIDKSILSNNGWVKECESHCKEINIYGNPLLSNGEIKITVKDEILIY